MRRAASPLLLLVVMAAGLPPARAQTRVVTLINADSVVVEGDSTGTVRRLFGNVAFRQDTTALYAGSAVQYVERGEIVLDGGVRITNGDDTLTARRVTYDANAKEALAVGNVRITDGETVLLVPSGRYFSRTRLATFDVGGRLLHDVSELTAPSGTYDAEAKVATFSGPVTLRDTAVVVTASSGRYEVRPKVAFLEGPVTLRDSVAVLTSQQGVYDVDAERADFLGEVRLVRRAVRLEADTLTYFRETEVADAAGRVVLARYGDEEEADSDAPIDSSRLTLLFADRIHHDDPNRVSTAEGGEPLAVVLTADSTGTVDTLLVRATSFEARRPEREDDRGALRLHARDSVRVVHPRFAAAGDSAAFTRIGAPEGRGEAPADTLRLFGGPSTWFDEAQVTGDTLVVAARGEAVEGIEVVGRAFTAQLDTVLGRVNQLRGRRMVGVFAADDLRRLSVWPTAEAIHFRATADGLLDGADRVSADSLVFTFEGGEVREVRGYGGIEGTTYGAQIVPTPLRLDGYTFTPERRPQRAVLLPPESRPAQWLAAQPPLVRAVPPPGTEAASIEPAPPPR